MIATTSYHTTNRSGDASKFQGKHLKFGLKSSTYNFEDSGNKFTKLYQAMCHKACVITWVLSLEGMPPTKFGRTKT